MKRKKETEIVPVEPATEAEDSGKMTIYEYEQKYTRRQNARGAKFLVRFLAALVGIVLIILLALLSIRVYELNEYAGYAVMGVSLVVFIVCYIVPVVKVMRTGYFITNVNAYTAKNAQRHNRKLRREIADKIIDLTAKVDGVGWYDSEVVGRLAIATKVRDDEGIKKALTELYRGPVKRSAKALIFKRSLKAAAYSAVSQASKVDAALVAVVNLQLIKDLVFLYGFRPSDAKLLKIFGTVLHNSLIAYGLGSLNIGSSVAQTMGSAMKGIPLLGSAIAAIVDSSVQGLVNGALTTVIGYQTIRYLNREYKLQNILDGIDVPETQADIEEACADLESELKKKKKRLAAAG